MQICGRDYIVVPPTIRHEKDRKKAYNRIHVEGLHKADGTHIRFKSTKKAEMCIRSMRLARD